MTETCLQLSSTPEPRLQLGREVPDFSLTTFDAVNGDFGKFSLAKQKEEGKWSILFFYPADFTFV